MNFSLNSVRADNLDLVNQDSLVNQDEGELVVDLVDRDKVDRAAKAVRVADQDKQVSRGNQVVAEPVVDLLQVKCDCHQFRY